MEYDNKPLRFFLIFSRIVYAAVLAVNLLLPIFDGKWADPPVFQKIICGVWTYGMLCSLGYFKKPVSREVDGVIKYEISVPILPIGLLRIAEALFYGFISRVHVDWRMFLICVGLDVFYVALILMDKSNYYYEGIETEVDEK